MTNKTLNANTKIKSYYMGKYSSDDLGKDIDANITFEDLFKCLDARQCIYTLINVDDSLVRERLFEALAIVMVCSYDYIYNQWLT